MPSTTGKVATAAMSKPTYPPSRLEQISPDNRHQTRAEVPQQRHEENHENPRQGIIAEQPRGGETMKAGGDAGEQEGPMRMRGGCIPCPGGGTCWIIPIPCCF